MDTATDDDRPRRRTGLLIAASAVAVAAAAGGLVAVVAAHPSADRRSPAIGRPAASSTAGVTTGATIDPEGVVPDGGTDVTPTGGVTVLRLVRGTRTVNGVLVGYPHSTLGAESAAVEYVAQIGSTLDVARATEVGRAAGDWSDGDPGPIFAQGPVNNRQGLGLPTTGPIPAGASMNVVPMAVQVRDVHTDQITVLVLGYLDTTTPGTATLTRIGVFPFLLVWTDGDWKIRQRADGAPDYADLRLDPGSQAATAAGWQPVTR